MRHDGCVISKVNKRRNCYHVVSARLVLPNNAESVKVFRLISPCRNLSENKLRTRIGRRCRRRQFYSANDCWYYFPKMSQITDQPTEYEMLECITPKGPKVRPAILNQQYRVILKLSPCFARSMSTNYDL